MRIITDLIEDIFDYVTKDIDIYRCELDQNNRLGQYLFTTIDDLYKVMIL